MFKQGGMILQKPKKQRKQVGEDLGVDGAVPETLVGSSGVYTETPTYPCNTA